MSSAPHHAPRLVFALLANTVVLATGATTPADWAERLGVEGMEKWSPETLPPPRMLPEVEWPFVSPESPPEPEFLDFFELRPARRTIIRPIGVPWFLPGELGTNKNGDLPGPGLGIGLSWTPSKNWRFGADLVVRADRVDADNRLHDWTPYLAPGVEFIPFPYSRHPFTLGIVTPWAPDAAGKDWAGAFLFIRWNELLGALPKAKW